ncbi:MAG TPA: hypothetical protein VGP46_08810, partial [Acidimicrobiales bacterium]|nr:hypothetical protein [Acidimicrobiales bacterium]
PPSLATMDRSAAIEQLPALHAVAVRLSDEGADDHLIAVALAVDDDQVQTILEIAHAKLANLLTAAASS